MASREMDKPLLLSAMLGSKDELAMMRLFPSDSDFYLDIDLEGVVEDVKRSYYSVSLYVADSKVAESTKSKPQSSVVKWEWKANNQM
jgi:hypothetical protein